MLEILCAALAIVVAGVIVKLWHYRAAIIQLQADMTLVLNDLTRPDTTPSMVCNLCDRRMTLSEYAVHECGKMKQRADALTQAQVKHVYDVTV